MSIQSALSNVPYLINTPQPNSPYLSGCLPRLFLKPKHE